MIELSRSAATHTSMLMLVLAAALAPGCSKTPRRPVPDLDNVAVRVVDRAGYDTLLSDQRGQVVLVDFWAHWCEPCIANFPHVMELAGREWDRGLAVVTVNMDAPEAVEKTVAFLTEQRAGAAVNLISQFGGGSKSMEAFEIPDGALPCYKIYDRKGQLRHTFALDPAAQKQFTLQELDAAIEQLMAD